MGILRALAIFAVILLATLLVVAPSAGARGISRPLLKDVALSGVALEQAYANPLLPFSYPYVGGLDRRPGVASNGYWSWQDVMAPIPSAQPLAVSVFVNAPSNNVSDPSFPPIDNVVSLQLPSGSFSRIVLRLDVALESAVPGRPGANYDRPLWIFVDGVPLLIGTTAQRFNWTVSYDVTYLYPLLVGGTHTFVLRVPNWVIPRLGLVGYFVVNATLLYYPGQPPPDAPDAIVPLWTWVALSRSTPYAIANATVPSNAVRALLYVFTEGASYDEFWWADIPTDRLLIVSAGQKVIAVTQPFPYIYTGGIMPFMWRPVPAIGTYAFDPLVVDVTPYLPFMVGSTTFNITITNNANYWLVGGFLALKLSQSPVSYAFIGDSPSLSRTESTTPTPTGAVYRVSVKYDNRASLNITVSGTTYTYTVAYSLSFVSVQAYNDVWWNSTVQESWAYTASAPGFGESRHSSASTVMLYREVVVPQGDISKATVSNPVPASDVLSVVLQQSYHTRVHRSAQGIASTLETNQQLYSNGYMNVGLLFVSPTGAVITSINAVFARTVKTAYVSYRVGPSELFRFTRYTAGGTNYPPLAYLLIRDVVGTYSAM
ncbi:MAG: peptide-N4-asparagine amidase [Desulfurococcaceae archaeon]